MRTRENYFPLLFVLVFTLSLIITLRDPMHRYILGFAFIFGLCGSSFAITHRVLHQALLLPFGASALIVHILFPTALAPPWLNVFDNVLWLAYTGYLAWIVFQKVFTSRRVGKQQIFGAISVYLLIGLVFTELFEILLYLDPNAIFFDPARFPREEIGTSQVLYYSFVTLATVGYGDVSPVIPEARALSVVESICGIMYLTVLVARFVSRYEDEIRVEAQGE